MAMLKRAWIKDLTKKQGSLKGNADLGWGATTDASAQPLDSRDEAVAKPEKKEAGGFAQLNSMMSLSGNERAEAFAQMNAAMAKGDENEVKRLLGVISQWTD